MRLDFMVSLYFSIPLSSDSVETILTILFIPLPSSIYRVGLFLYISSSPPSRQQMLCKQNLSYLPLFSLSHIHSPLISFPNFIFLCAYLFPFPSPCLCFPSQHPLPHGSGYLCSDSPSSQEATMISCHSFLLGSVLRISSYSSVLLTR